MTRRARHFAPVVPNTGFAALLWACASPGADPSGETQSPSPTAGSEATEAGSASDGSDGTSLDSSASTSGSGGSVGSGEADGSSSSGGSSGSSDSGGSDTGGNTLPPPGTLPDSGYEEVACGFDMNRNGVRGEPEDCNVGDGVTTDPDGDGTDEDIVYVDCDGGSDDASCGAPSSPCGSITYALANRLDGPDDGAEDIVAFRGTCAEDQLDPPRGGVPGTYTQSMSGSEPSDWELPQNPLMIVGWDSDDDGDYPANDADDTAVLEGTGLYRAFSMPFPPAGHFEIAHFTAQNYGRQAGSDGGGFMEVRSPFTYVHDIALYDINREMDSQSDRIVFHMFHAGGAEYFQARNLLCSDCGGYFTRGGPGGGPFRFQHLHVVMHPCSWESCPMSNPGAPGGRPQFGTLMKWWGPHNGAEWLDSVADFAPDNRELGDHPSHHGSGILTGQCAQDYVVRNSEFINFGAAMALQPYATGFCDTPDVARPVTNIHFDRNLVRHSYDGFQGNGATLVRGGPLAESRLGDVSITNSTFQAEGSGELRACLLYLSDAAAPISETITFSGNTCDGAQEGGIALLAQMGDQHDNWVVEDNTFINLGGSASNIDADYVPSNWQGARNAYDSDAGYKWGSDNYDDLAGFQGATQSEADSVECPDASCSP